MRKILVLGGTTEAREIASALNRVHGIVCITSLAGRTLDPVLPQGHTRIGGFGGPTGLAQWIADESITVVVDATHPFAARISSNVQSASALTGIPLIRLMRPPWQSMSGDRWIDAASYNAAAATVAELDAASPFLTIGRQSVFHFASNSSRFLIRCIDRPECAVPVHTTLLLGRGPFTLDSELELLQRHNVDVLVTKNSGGAMTYPKIEAARLLNIPVVMVSRPVPPHDADAATFGDTAELLDWILQDYSGDCGRTESG